MQQISFSDLAYTHKKKTTRKERFLAEMNDLLPWKHLLKAMVRKYPKPGQGRRPIPPEVMLRILSRSPNGLRELNPIAVCNASSGHPSHPGKE